MIRHVHPAVQTVSCVLCSAPPHTKCVRITRKAGDPIRYAAHTHRMRVRDYEKLRSFFLRHGNIFEMKG